VKKTTNRLVSCHGKSSIQRVPEFHDEFAVKLMMLPEYAISLQIVAMDNHLTDDELAAQLAMTLPECWPCLQLLAV
jgi:hypothetical protein